MILRLALGVLVSFVLACGDTELPARWEPSAPVPAVTPPPPAPPTTPDPPKTEVPSGSLRGDAEAGAFLYAQYCSSCHGANGKGDGPMSASLVPSPRDHTDPAYMDALSDEYLYTVIQKGGAAVGKSPLMAPWGGVVTEEDTKDLIAHLRTLSGS